MDPKTEEKILSVDLIIILQAIPTINVVPKKIPFIVK